MRELPKSEVYEKEFKFMPWGILIREILTIIEKETPKEGKVLDLMCGPGYLLGKINNIRSDLLLEGVDINEEFIQFAKKKYLNISFEAADVTLWNSTNKYDLILCTAGIHHLPYDKQSSFLEKVSKLLKSEGFAIFADPYIDDYSNEIERKKAAAKLGHEYLITTINKGASDDVIKATVDIIHNDVMGFEYKTSLKKLEPIFRKLFSQIVIKKTWPESKTEYGEYYIICKKA